MKTTLKKTMAALSAAAVVAASAAVMAVPASAASATVSVSSVEMTLSELAAADYTVTLSISASEDVTNAGFGLTALDGLAYVGSSATVSWLWGSSAYVDGTPGEWIAAAAMGTAIPAGEIGTVTVEVPETAAAGDVYTVQVDTVGKDGRDGQFANQYGDGAYDLVGANGTITIVADPVETTEPPVETTEVPAETTTAAPVASPVTTTTTKKAAQSTSSPKTGDALPVAGVAVAVAVIGGVALVAKKRK